MAGTCAMCHFFDATRGSRICTVCQGLKTVSMADFLEELLAQIERQKTFNPPMDSHAAGVIVGMQEAADLLEKMRADV